EVVAWTYVQRGQRIFLETGRIEFRAIVSCGDSIEGILPVAIGRGLRNGATGFIFQDNARAGDDRSRWIGHLTAEVPVAAQQRCGVGLRRELHSLWQGKHGASPGIRVRELV